MSPRGSATVPLVSDLQNIRGRFTPDLAGRWRDVLAARKISQQDALTAMAEWLVEQDSLTQTIVFGQVEKRDHPDLARLVLKRLAAGGAGKAKGK